MRLKAIAIAISICSGGALVASPFTNGSFESPVVTATPDFVTQPTGWTVVQAGNQSQALFMQLDTTFGIPFVAANGHQSFGFGGNGGNSGSLSQTFDTVAGASYTIGYQYLIQQGSEVEALRVEALDGVSVLNSDQFSFNNMLWQNNVFTFTAASTATTLRFSDVTTVLNPGVGAGTNWALDAVTVTQGSVTGTPEPATFGLIGMAGVAGFLFRRAKKRV